MSNATPRLSRSPVSCLMNAARLGSGSAQNHGSTMERQMDVQERVAGSLARKSTQSVRFTQASSAARLRRERAMVAGAPPMLSTQRNASSASSTQSIDGVLMVEPLKTSSSSSPPLVRRKIFGSGQGGV